MASYFGQKGNVMLRDRSEDEKKVRIGITNKKRMNYDAEGVKRVRVM